MKALVWMIAVVVSLKGYSSGFVSDDQIDFPFSSVTIPSLPDKISFAETSLEEKLLKVTPYYPLKNKIREAYEQLVDDLIPLSVTWKYEMKLLKEHGLCLEDFDLSHWKRDSSDENGVSCFQKSESGSRQRSYSQKIHEADTLREIEFKKGFTKEIRWDFYKESNTFYHQTLWTLQREADKLFLELSFHKEQTDEGDHYYYQLELFGKKYDSIVMTLDKDGKFIRLSGGLNSWTNNDFVFCKNNIVGYFFDYHKLVKIYPWGQIVFRTLDVKHTNEGSRYQIIEEWEGLGKKIISDQFFPKKEGYKITGLSIDSEEFFSDVKCEK
tara:strand:- start:1477 stop:2451 length:975 start_codon:yes stop_codon:yes gene_type:complete